MDTLFIKNNFKMQHIKQNSKIAVLGASLPMLILALFLKKKNKVDILNENKKIGGAWKFFKYKNINIRKQSNVIVPTSKYQEDNIYKINSFLKKKFKIKIKKSKSKIITNYNFKDKFIYDFDHFYKNFPKKIIKSILVKDIKIKKNKKVVINKSLEYDYIIFPSYFGIKKIYNEKKLLNLPFKKIISEHMVAIIKSDKFNKIYYSDYFNSNFNGYFDRAQFLKHNGFKSFSARISKSKKGITKKRLANILLSEFTNNEIVSLFKFKYENFHRDEKQLKNFIEIQKLKPIIYIDTRSFVRSLIEILKLIRKN